MMQMTFVNNRYNSQRYISQFIVSQSLKGIEGLKICMIKILGVTQIIKLFTSRSSDLFCALNPRPLKSFYVQNVKNVHLK